MDIITLESKRLLKPDVLPLRLAVEESSVPHLGEQVGPPVTGTVGEPVSLPCRMSGSPEPYLSWILPNGKVVRRGTAVPGGLTIETNGSLYLPNPSLRDGGHYRCTAVNHYGRDGLSVQLLTTLEVWTRPPRMQLASYREATIHQGGEVHLECQADGVPAPLLSWVLPDRSVMTSAGPSTSRISVDTNGTLHISVTLPSDRGVYRCVASNSAGAASTSVRVHVSSLPPVIQQPREEHLLLSPGRPVYAHCSARGAPPPTLRWRIPDGTLVRPSQFLHGNLFVLTNGTLHIRKVGPKDSGSYECTATSNSAGERSRVVRLEVETPTYGLRGPSPVTYTRPGVAVELPCLTIATPRATVTWETPDLMQLKVMAQPRIYGNRYLSPQGSLVIQNPTSMDTGFYKCTAKNVIGVDTKATYLLITLHFCSNTEQQCTAQCSIAISHYALWPSALLDMTLPRCMLANGLDIKKSLNHLLQFALIITQVSSLLVSHPPMSGWAETIGAFPVARVQLINFFAIYMLNRLSADNVLPATPHSIAQHVSFSITTVSIHIGTNVMSYNMIVFHLLNILKKVLLGFKNVILKCCIFMC
uniref:Ig-like domain-containing protein n=1 Tax=Oreochromis niloticus TaxID=8128 RepID=A0A669C3S5_ORENI